MIELSKQQEVTKQSEAREREADYKRQAAMFAKVGGARPDSGKGRT